jgi:hypothetical protein
MKKMIFLIIAVLVIALNGIELGFSAKTGDAEFDMFLNDVNTTAKMDLRLFKSEISAEYKTTDKTIDEGMVKLKMEPAELYLSLEMAKIMKKEPVEVMNVYSSNKNEGWGVIAQKMGIKPGSREFKALKKKTQYKKDKHKRDKLNKENTKAEKIDKKSPKDSNK